jgi:hypothetical protein
MSIPDALKFEGLVFNPDEERWFAASEPRPFRPCLPAPPSPIGDAMADAWFR